MSCGNSHKRGPRINAPEHDDLDDPAYQRECTFAVDASVESLIEFAAKAGWERQHVIVAIIFAAARHLDDQAIFERIAGLAGAMEGSDAIH